ESGSVHDISFVLKLIHVKPLRRYNTWHSSTSLNGTHHDQLALHLWANTDMEGIVVSIVVETVKLNMLKNPTCDGAHRLIGHYKITGNASSRTNRLPITV